jgi:hypothetical protein
VNSIIEDVREYERWLRKQCSVVDSGVEEKHKRMRKSAFDFLRATYFRWARVIETVCGDLHAAPRVMSVGDTHVENFGTWRDADGRLVWGVNDFDEAAVMQYPYDLVRLATSALLAPRIDLTPAQTAREVARGYARGLVDPRPTLLDQHAQQLRPFADGDVAANRKFWQGIAKCPEAKPPSAARRVLLGSLPKGARLVRFGTRQSGAGSLGRPRYVAIAEWRSGIVVREAKALVPSAWAWAHGKGKRTKVEGLAGGTYRAPDAALRARGRWLVRRLAPDSRKLDFRDIAKSGLTAHVLFRMAADIGAVHAADKRSANIQEDLASRAAKWLLSAANAAHESVLEDYDEYCRSHKR